MASRPSEERVEARPFEETRAGETRITGEHFCRQFPRDATPFMEAVPNAPSRASSTKATVVFDACGDIHPRKSYVVSFPDAKVVFMNRCDKNFVYYWLRPRVFPNVERIYLFSHPCMPNYLRAFPETTEIYFSKWYEEYKTRWYPSSANIHIMTPALETLRQDPHQEPRQEPREGGGRPALELAEAFDKWLHTRGD